MPTMGNSSFFACFFSFSFPRSYSQWVGSLCHTYFIYSKENRCNLYQEKERRKNKRCESNSNCTLCESTVWYIWGEYWVFQRRKPIWANEDATKEKAECRGKSSLSSTNKRFRRAAHKNQPRIIHSVDVVLANTHAKYSIYIIQHSMGTKFWMMLHSPSADAYSSRILSLQSFRTCHSHIRLYHFLAHEHRPKCRPRSTYIYIERMWALVFGEHAHRPIGCLYFRPYFSDCPIIVSATFAGFHSVLVRCWLVFFLPFVC